MVTQGNHDIRGGNALRQELSCEEGQMSTTRRHWSAPRLTAMLVATTAGNINGGGSDGPFFS